MKKFEKRVKRYLTERGWHELRPSDLAKSIIIEGAELLEIFQWDNQTLREVKRDKEKMNHIKQELADVMSYCFDFAVILNFDVEKILNEQVDKVIRKYPKKLFNKKTKVKDPGTEEDYW